MKMNKIAILLITIIVTLPLFSITAAAATDNGPQVIQLPASNMDYSADVEHAPLFAIRARTDVNENAYFLLSLSSSATWAFNSASDAEIGKLFTKTGNSAYVSNSPRLTNEPGLEYTLNVLTERDVQITINDVSLRAGNYIHIPLIVKLDGVAEALVSVLDGDVFGITSGTYVFANEGWVNEATINTKASTTAKENVITGDVRLDMSACLGDSTIELTLPSGFVFDNSQIKHIELVGTGSYSNAKIVDLWVDTPQKKMLIKIEGGKLSTERGVLTIKNITVNALENAPEGEIVMNFDGYDAKNIKFVFGVYEKAPKEEPEAPEEKPAKVEINASATSGSKNVIVNGEETEMPVAPYNNADGRMMVPLRFLAGAFGVGGDNVDWNEQNRSVTVVFETPSSKSVIVFTIGSSEYIVDGQEKTMDTAAIIKDNYTFVPVYYVADAFGIDVKYIPETKTAEFTGVFE